MEEPPVLLVAQYLEVELLQLRLLLEVVVELLLHLVGQRPLLDHRFLEVLIDESIIRKKKLCRFHKGEEKINPNMFNCSSNIMQIDHY